MPESTRGFNNWTVKGKYTQQTFVDEIKKRYKETDIVPTQRSFRTHASYYLFGSWTEALIMAGITPKEVKGDTPIIRQFIIDEVKQLAIELKKAPAKSDYSRWQKAISLFGSWNAVLKEAKIETRLFVEGKEVK
ncbi:hypothetical protein LTWDN19_19110 [Latilactobacillus curvatus]|uniref:Uncharacterized protein n=1 Tax=Latilactobacillus curvatus TaxID=28038 RepID=A0ABM7QWF3_LATCU|nr:hypothetical protein [Latilactobacillus curvatus]BCX31344.1 hypothetical protein LTWDN19_19110 [Latilactobacillus curvatus]